MTITSELLLDLLRKNWKIEIYGQSMGNRPLLFPAFYQANIQPEENRVYVLRAQDLPSAPSRKCLYICLGRRPVPFRQSYAGEVFYVADANADIFSVFNRVQQIFEEIIQWDSKMRDLLEQHGDIKEMMRISIPILQNRIIIVDYRLKVIAYCQTRTDTKAEEPEMSDIFEEIPEAFSSFFQKDYQQMMRIRKPYKYQSNDRNNYCVNLYLRDTYMGVCALSEDYRSFRESDFLLFNQFAGYIGKALADQSRDPASSFATVNTIFEQILNCMPVSQSDLERALDLLERNPAFSGLASRRWNCVVITSINRGKNLPEEYLRSKLEKHLPSCLSLLFQNSIVLFMASPKNGSVRDILTEKLPPFLSDMNFQAGVSESFPDIFRARTYYAQAQNAIRTGAQYDFESSDKLYFFSEQALFYMLEHSCGEFDPEDLMPEGLLALIQHPGNTDYLKTLEIYLENEMNASKTAQQLYLHRSSVMARLEKIHSLIDLDTPQQRLYIRMCIQLYELTHRKET